MVTIIVTYEKSRNKTVHTIKYANRSITLPCHVLSSIQSMLTFRQRIYITSLNKQINTVHTTSKVLVTDYNILD